MYTHVGARELPSIDSISFAYTPNGSLADVVETKTTSSGVTLEQTHRTFDALERMSSQTRDYGTTQKTTLFGYDVKGNRTSVTDFTGASTVYELDSVDRVKKATTPSGTVAFKYFVDGLPKSAAYTAGSATLTQQRCYDNASRLTSLVSAVGLMNDDCTVPAASSTLRRFSYSFDSNGNRTRQEEMLGTAPAEVSEYGFDANDRLVASVEGADAKLYQLDAVGNRTGEKKTTAAAARALGLTAAAFLALAPADTLAHVRGDFNRADWLTARTQLVPVTGGGTTNVFHDANGNLTRQDGPAGTREYRYDVRNTLTVAFESGSEIGRYSYDWQRSRVGRTAHGQSVDYVLDGKFVLNELDASQASRPSTRRYHYGETRPLAVADSSGARWLLNDGLGSVTDEVLLTGSLFRQRQYDAWGEYRNATAPAPSEVKVGYTGMEFDPETGLTHSLGVRYYNASLGVWLQRDDYEGELRNAPSLHRFAYTHNNPLKYTDRNGRAANLVAAGIGAAIGFGVMFTAALLDDRPVGEAFVTGLGGAAIGGLAGLTFGASLAAGAPVGTVVAATGVKALIGGGVDVARQVVESKAHPGTKFSYREVVTSAGLSAAIPGAGVLAQSPKVATTVGGLSVAGGAVVGGRGAGEIVEGIESGNPWQVTLGAMDTALGLLGVGAGARGLPSLSRPPVSPFLARGTSEGYAGDPVLQQLQMTPTSEDPAVAALFAAQSAKYGTPVVQIAPREGLPIGPSNVLAAKEAEVGVALTPLEFASKAQAFDLPTVQAALKNVGVEVPSRISDIAELRTLINETPKLLPDQKAAFYEQLGLKKQ